MLGLKMNLLKEAKAEVLYLKGQDASWTGHESSRFHLMQSIHASPKNIKPRLELAQSYITAQKYDDAVEEYVEAFKVSYQAGQIEEALRVYDMAFTLKPDELILSEDMEFQVGMKCTKYAHYELGYLVFQKLHRLRPNHPKTERILAKLISLCSNKLGQHHEAHEYFQELESTYPHSRYIEIFRCDMNKIEDQPRVPPQKTSP